MSVVSVPIVNKQYQMGCDEGQESRLLELGKMVDNRARAILDKMGPLPENALLATICIVLADEIVNLSQNSVNNDDLQEILARIKIIKNKIKKTCL